MGTLWEEISGKHATLSAAGSALNPSLEASERVAHWPGAGRAFIAADILHLRGRQVRALRDFHAVSSGALGDIGEGSRTSHGWLLQVVWRSGPQAGMTDWFTRGEANQFLGLLPPGGR